MTEPRPPIGSRLRASGRIVPKGLDEELIAAVVDSFYGRARRDPLLGPVFNAAIPGPEWARHMAIISDFWSSMLLGTGRYAGRPMPVHLALDGVDDRHFSRWLALFKETVETQCSPDIAALFLDRAERVANSFRFGMAVHRGEDSTAIVPMRVIPTRV
jgi:hemoglobin